MTVMLTDKDIEILSSQTPQTLAEWWCLLNRWEWPSEIPNEESTEVYSTFMCSRGGPGVKHSRRGELADWIDSHVAQKLISRTWNKKMTDAEFEDFWRGHYEGDVEALRRDEARTSAEVEARVRRREMREWPEFVYDVNDWPDLIADQ